MKLEHFRSLHITGYDRWYNRGAKAAAVLNVDGVHDQRRFLVLQTAQTRINERRYDDAAYLIGYADTMCEYRD